MPHQIIGLVAISLTLAALLRGWGLPRRIAAAVAGLGLVGSLLFALIDTGRRVEPDLPPSGAGTMPPQESVAAPARPGGVEAFFP